MIGDARLLWSFLGARRVAAIVVGAAALGALTASIVVAHYTTPKEQQ